MGRMSALESHVAQSVAQSVAMKMFSLLAGKGGKYVALPGSPDVHLTEQCDGLPRQRNDMWSPHLHLVAGNGPFGGLKVELRPLGRSNQTRSLCGQHRQNQSIASYWCWPLVDGFDYGL